MQKRKTALFSFSNEEGMLLLANTLIRHDWDIHASVENVEFLENNGINRKSLHPFQWNNLNYLVSPNSSTLLSISTKEEENSFFLEKDKIPQIDLICVDFHETKESSIKMLNSECVKTFLVTAAIHGNKIPICKIGDRKDVSDWIEKEMPNKNNYLLELKSTAALEVAQFFMNLGRGYDHLRK